MGAFGVGTEHYDLDLTFETRQDYLLVAAAVAEAEGSKPLSLASGRAEVHWRLSLIDAEHLVEVRGRVEAQAEGNLLAGERRAEQIVLGTLHLEAQEVLGGRESRVALELLAELGVAHAGFGGDVLHAQVVLQVLPHAFYGEVDADGNGIVDEGQLLAAGVDGAEDESDVPRQLLLVGRHLVGSHLAGFLVGGTECLRHAHVVDGLRAVREELVHEHACKPACEADPRFRPSRLGVGGVVVPLVRVEDDGVARVEFGPGLVGRDEPSAALDDVEYLRLAQGASFFGEEKVVLGMFPLGVLAAGLHVLHSHGLCNDTPLVVRCVCKQIFTGSHWRWVGGQRLGIRGTSLRKDNKNSRIICQTDKEKYCCPLKVQ